jgi:hypothetical protein
MKNYLLVLLLFLYNGLCAQKVHFTDRGNRWEGIVHADMPQVPYSTYNWTAVSYRDTNYLGHTYKILSLTSGSDFMMVREDTTAGKVYAVSMYNYIPYCDTVEQVLYDYNLLPGDTLVTHDLQHQYTCVLQDTGSAIINGVRHRVQYFEPVQTVGFQTPYDVIEGIGCTRFPGYPLTPYSEFGILLTCFHQHTAQPLVSPLVGHFDNYGSCALGISDITEINGFTVFPNPASGNTTVSFKNMYSGSLSVIGADGRLQQKIPVEHQRKIQLDCSNLAAGVYFILLQSSESKNIGHQKIIIY